jgi:hypothetical protein
MKKDRDDLNDQERLILEMWADGATGTEIANQIGKTRSAVLGKLNRLRIKGFVGYKVSKMRIEAQKIKLGTKKPPPPTKKKTIKTQLNSKAIKKNFVFSMKADRKRQEPVFIEPTPSKEGDPVTFMQLEHWMCKYVVSGDRAADFKFCGQKAVKKRFCEQHHKLCYVPYKESTRRKENA